MSLDRMTNSECVTHEVAHVGALSNQSPDILNASSTMGFWSGFTPYEGKPQLYGNNDMMYLLGVDEDDNLSPEELHEYWYKRVDPDYYGEVDGYFKALSQGEEAEIEYPWNHPKLGRIIIRCGGKIVSATKEGFRVEGYHRNISNVLHFQKHTLKTTSEMTIADSVLSFVARKAYSIVITVNLKSGDFSFISGSGMEHAAADIQNAQSYRECYNLFYAHCKQEYKKQLCDLLSLDSLRNLEVSDGFIGSLEFISFFQDKECWRESSVYLTKDQSGKRIANILFRSIDAIKRQQNAKLKEIEAINSRMRVFAEITQKIFGFNVTVHLNSGNFTIITGCGLDNVIPIMRSTSHYPTVLDRMLSLVDPAQVQSLRRLLGIDFLLAAEPSNNSLGTETFSVLVFGKRYWHEITVFRMTDENGNPTANILCRDVTSIKEAEAQREREKLREQYSRNIMIEITRALFGYSLTVNLSTLDYKTVTGNGTDNVISIFKNHSKYDQALDEKIKSVDPSDLKKLLDLVSVKNLRRASKEGRTGLLDSLTYKVNLSNKPSWHEITVFIGTDIDGNPIANMLGRDVTEIKLKQDAELKNERAANAARSYFFSTVSHDIRTPLNAIIGYTELLKMGIDDPNERDQALDSVVTSSKALLHLINDVLDLSKLESGKMEITNEPVDAFSLINETLSAFSLVCTKKQIKLVRNISHLPTLMLDPQRIRQILFNIIGNAVKFTLEGSITISASYTDQELVISVADTGCGIRKNDIPRIMTPFSQVGGAGRNGGTGLGLAICKQLAERMGGALTVQSEFGVGTTFTITLPHVHTAEEEAPKTSASKKHEFAPAIDISLVAECYPENVLIVDDSIVNLKVLNAMLRKLGIKNVSQAASGSQALEMLHSQHFDLILTDLWMPQMNGVKFAEMVRIAERTAGRDPTPVCAVTADVESVKSDSSARFDGILLKPVTIENLKQLLKKYKDMGGGGNNIVAL